MIYGIVVIAEMAQIHGTLFLLVLCVAYGDVQTVSCAAAALITGHQLTGTRQIVLGRLFKLRNGPSGEKVRRNGETIRGQRRVGPLCVCPAMVKIDLNVVIIYLAS